MSRGEATTAPSAWRSRIVGEEDVAPDQLLAHPENFRRHPKHQQDAMLEALDRLGYVQRVVVNKRTGHVVDGHLRVELALRRGQPTVPCVYVDLSEAEERLALATLDPIGAMASIDDPVLQQLLADVRASDDQVAELLEAIHGEPPRAPVPGEDELPQAVEPRSRPGDLWVLGEHRLLCGDATSSEDVKELLNGTRPRLMVTDPPYGVEYDATWRGKAGHATMGKNRVGKVACDNRADWREAWMLFPGSIAYVWHGGLLAGVVAESLVACGFKIRSQIIWAKTVMVMGRGDYHWEHEPCWYAVKGDGHWLGDRRQTTVWQAASPIHIMSGSDEEKTPHPTQKPAEVMRRPMINHTRSGESVYDPFVGSGTSIIAAETVGRRCYALELDPGYCDVAVQRWQAFTGREAKLFEPDVERLRTFDEVAAERAK